MKAKNIREMAKGELSKFIEDQKTKALQLRFDIVTKQIKNKREYRNVKRDVARALTISKQLANQELIKNEPEQIRSN